MLTLRKSLALSLGLAALWLTGCEKPPMAEMDQARQAVEGARQAEAAQYAPQALAVLQDSLDTGLKEVERQNNRFALLRNYQVAQKTLAWVNGQGPKVAKTARETKEKIRRETQEMIQAASAAIDTSAAMIARAPRGKESAEEIALFESDLQNLRGALQSAEVDFKAEDFTAAQSQAQSIKSRAENLQREVSAAALRYEELMAKAKQRRRRG
jgi:hypothetical protein